MSAESFRIFDTAAQLKHDYPWLAPVPIAFKQTAPIHPYTQRRDIPLTPPTYREAVSPAHELLKVICEGVCLEPYFAGRSCKTFDARLSAQDGDYVLIEISDHIRRLLQLFARDDELWRRRYSGGVPDTWVKQLRVLDDVAWIVEKSSALPLSTNRVLGVLVGSP